MNERQGALRHNDQASGWLITPVPPAIKLLYDTGCITRSLQQISCAACAAEPRVHSHQLHPATSSQPRTASPCQAPSPPFSLLHACMLWCHHHHTTAPHPGQLDHAVHEQPARPSSQTGRISPPVPAGVRPRPPACCGRPVTYGPRGLAAQGRRDGFLGAAHLVTGCVGVNVPQPCMRFESSCPVWPRNSDPCFIPVQHCGFMWRNGS